MNKFIEKELLTHPFVLSSLGLVVVIAAGSIFYYGSATRVPDTQALTETASSTHSVTGSGVIEPAENPDLAFQSGGRVTTVAVKVGDTVTEGEVLASLDTKGLLAARAQAEANVEAAQAHLAEMLAPARQADVNAKQTAVDVANASLVNLYASIATNILGAYDKVFSGFSQYTDNLFNQANTSNPSLSFFTSNSQSAIAAVQSRLTAQNELALWQTETNSISSSSSNADIEAELALSLKHLQVFRTYSDLLISALGNAVFSNSFTQSSASTAQVSVGVYRDSVNSLITMLQGEQQQIALSKLSIQSAKDALAQVTASATAEQIAGQQAVIAAAKANVDSIDAQIRNQTIVAPFRGTVASVPIKVGDVVSPNTKAFSLNPESALQISVYFSQIDITKLHVGDKAEVTLDAYGSSRVFDADVVSVDSAPSDIGDGGGRSGYKATFQFEKSDPSITPGMTANITIPLSN